MPDEQLGVSVERSAVSNLDLDWPTLSETTAIAFLCKVQRNLIRNMTIKC